MAVMIREILKKLALGAYAIALTAVLCIAVLMLLILTI